jgi:hypothetical protein
VERPLSSRITVSFAFLSMAILAAFIALSLTPKVISLLLPDNL